MINIFYFLSFFSFIASCDLPQHFQYKIQDPATENLEWMIDLYDLICFELIVIVSVVLMLLISLLYSPTHSYSNSNAQLRYSKKSFSHSTELEIFWTIVPAILLITIAYPSFNLLYALDEEFDYIEYAIKIIGHQWYWTYEYHIGYKDVKFDSYMVDQKDLARFYPGLLYTYSDDLRFTRLLEVDNRLILPAQAKIVLLITSADVLHSWTVPSFGVKVDACPGRLTKANLCIKRPGIYFGQCSEICGINHGFMPITVQALPSDYGYCFAKYAGYEHATTFLKSPGAEFSVDTFEDVLFVRKLHAILNLKSNYGYNKNYKDLRVTAYDEALYDDSAALNLGRRVKSPTTYTIDAEEYLQGQGNFSPTEEQIKNAQAYLDEHRDERYVIYRKQDIRAIQKRMEITQELIDLLKQLGEIDSNGFANTDEAAAQLDQQRAYQLKIEQLQKEIDTRIQYEIEHNIFRDYDLDKYEMEKAKAEAEQKAKSEAIRKEAIGHDIKEGVTVEDYKRASRAERIQDFKDAVKTDRARKK